MRSLVSKSSIVLILGVGLAVSASAQRVTTIRNNGSSANRVDLVILGDGYTASQLGQYAIDVQSTVQAFFSQEPFREYQKYFNVHRIDLVSNQSGADHPESGQFRDTALDATYNCAGVQRLICVDQGEAISIAARRLAANQREMILVLVNDEIYGGSGGAVAVASLHSSVVELVLHELGHSFGLLADEYGGPPPPDCNRSFEPFESNATLQTQRGLVKWGAWINAATPLPSPGGVSGVPGLYEGARYCDTGVYRPTDNSKMRSLGLPFEQINSEQLVLRIHNFVSPLDKSAPAGNSVRMKRRQQKAFSVSTPLPLTHALTVNWFVDGVLRASGPRFTLNGTSLAVGTHTLQAVVSDPTPLVRNPGQRLAETRTWTVRVTP